MSPILPVLWIAPARGLSLAKPGIDNSQFLPQIKTETNLSRKLRKRGLFQRLLVSLNPVSLLFRSFPRALSDHFPPLNDRTRAPHHGKRTSRLPQGSSLQFCPPATISQPLYLGFSRGQTLPSSSTICTLRMGCADLKNATGTSCATVRRQRAPPCFGEMFPRVPAHKEDLRKSSFLSQHPLGTQMPGPENMERRLAP